MFHYGAIISPPKDWDRWGELVGELTAHLVERYGRDEVRRWAFEIWNEANLDVFWAGTRDEYFRLYDISAAAVKAVDPALPVGGPASAAAAWIDEMLIARRPVGRADRLPVHPHLRQRPARPAPDRRPSRPARRPAVVDRVGRPRDALQPGPRLGVERRLPRPRHGQRDGSARRPRLLDGLGPLRGARAAAGAAPRRLRAAQRRQPAQAAVVGAVDARAAARRPARRPGRRATAPATWSTPSPPGMPTGRWRSSSGTAPSTSPSPAVTSSSTGGST